MPSPAANIIEDGPDTLSTYDVEAGAETYRIRAIDSYTAERKARAMFHEAWGFFPTHVKACYVAKAKLIEAVSDVMIIPAEASH